VRVHFDFDSNAKFLSCYLPAAACRGAVFDPVADGVNQWLTIGDGLEVQMGLPGEQVRSSRDLRFAGHLFIYHDAEVEGTVQDAVRTRALGQGVVVQFRGPEFAVGRARFEGRLPSSRTTHETKTLSPGLLRLDSQG
jgi:hypothetical protein